MPHVHVRQDKVRRPSLVTFFGLLGLFILTAGFLDFTQPAARAASVFVVNSTGDGADSNTADNLCNDGAGNCTLRAAIQQANATPGTDTVNFQIGTGVQTIVLNTVLPDVSDPIIIDGTTQPGYGGTPLVEIKGKDEGFAGIPWVLHITAGGSTVRALAVGHFDFAGILLGTEGANDAGGNKVESCYGGLRADGVTPASRFASGACVQIADSPNNIIGGTSVAGRNVLSGCSRGVEILGIKSTGNLIQSNFIGTNAAGTAAVGVQVTGVQIGNASNNVIGGDTAAARNIISGNREAGIRITGSAAGNAVKSNYIGMDAAGTAALPNLTGVALFSGNNVVGGLAPLPGEAPGNRIVSQSVSLQINGSGVIVQGNLLGTNVTGSSAFTIGIFSFAQNVVIGGTQPGARNVISGFRTGISIEFGAAVIQGNYVGTDLSGTAARGNIIGISVAGSGGQIGGTTPGAGNLISGNRQGLVLRGAGVTVQGNLIGTDASGAAPLPNQETGIFIDGRPTDLSDGASASVVGGTAAGAGNRIAFNRRSGIAIGPYTNDGVFSTGNRLRGNSIFSNGLLGIDLVKSTQSNPNALNLDADGPSPNDEGDTDTGPNGMQNAPTVLSGQISGGMTSVQGRLNSAPNQTYAIDLYASTSCDPTDHGEGQTYLGATQATTNAAGVATFDGSFPMLSSAGRIITATSTDAAGNTSEFSLCQEAGASNTVQFGSFTYTTDEAMAARIIVSRTLGTTAATVDYATSDINTSAGADYVPAAGTLQFAPGEMSKAIDVTIIDDELDENDEFFQLTLSNPTGDSVLGAIITTAVHIVDNDAPPTMTVTDASVAEGDSGTTAAVFTIKLSAASGQMVPVAYHTSGGTATEGDDYTSTSGLLGFDPGETSKTVNVNVNVNTTPEPNETFSFNILGATHAIITDSQGVGTILNDDAVLGINDRSVGEGDSSQTAFNFTVSLQFPTVNPVSVNFATADGTAAAGSDYIAASGTLNFAAGETTKTVNVNVNGDTVDEANETFFVNLSDATNAGLADAQGQGTITNDDDNAPALRFSQASYSVGESAHVVTVTVTRTGDPAPAVGVDFATSDGTATERRDYTAVSGSLRFATGEISKTFDVLLTEDSYQEPEETINLTLSNPTGGAILRTPLASVVSIAADDATQPQPNPIDDTTNFVRQHYHDFLNREPDAEGLAFWVGDIEQCGADPGCREAQRINVSAAFFLSIEFQQTGYLVYRAYKAAYGDATSPNVAGTVPVVRLQEFLPDTRRIGEGVVVGTSGWEQKLESNKNAYLAECVQRQRFLTAYPLTMTAAQFVDKLNQNAGGVLTQAERDGLVGDLATNAKTRAQVLRAVAEHTALQQNELRRAFVLMQFYGYLRRNPDDPQDTDFRGWKFWLTKLNEFNGNFVQAEMVKAFLDSDEYRKRFGQ
ncbi:MAG: Calx-beta domain-containing protein [Pyrinomonadaceae bacterium]